MLVLMAVSCYRSAVKQTSSFMLGAPHIFRVILSGVLFINDRDDIYPFINLDVVANRVNGGATDGGL